MNAGVSGPLRLVQFSDCHVPSDPAARYRGLDAGGALERLSGAVRSYSPDLVLLTGDVSEDGSPASYGRVSARLNTVGAPVLALPGNHDDPEVMQRFFPVGPWNGPHQQKERNWQLVLLDSTAPGRIDGVLSRQSLQALKTGLQRSQSQHVLVVLHHQPVPIGSPWIDRYALDDPEWLLGLLDRDERVRGVLFGHVHQAIGMERKHALLLGSPSSVAGSNREAVTASTAAHQGSCTRYQ